MYKFRLRLVRWLPQHFVVLEAALILVLAFVVTAQPVQAAGVVRLQKRSLLINSPEPGAVSTYKFSFIYTTPENIGSVGIEFCISPIPDDPCTVPAGFDISGAILADQTGETGYAITQQTVNRIVLSRTPQMTSATPGMSTYTFTGVKNPSGLFRSFAARLGTHTSTNASDPFPYVNVGSVTNQTVTGIAFETQVPPILIFCLGKEVSADCEEVSGGNYSDMGNLTPNDTLMATSQMAVGTNATGGFVITANGPTMQSGINVINNLSIPTPSKAGTPQFGMNLRANSEPSIGNDPDGTWNNAFPTTNYDIPNRYTYNDGDAVASSSEVSLQKRFTVSYITNASQDLRPGVYTTSIAFVCSGRF